MRTRYTKVYPLLPSIEIFVKKVTSITIINGHNDENNNNNNVIMMVVPTANTFAYAAGTWTGNGSKRRRTDIYVKKTIVQLKKLYVKV